MRASSGWRWKRMGFGWPYSAAAQPGNCASFAINAIRNTDKKLAGMGLSPMPASFVTAPSLPRELRLNHSLRQHRVGLHQPHVELEGALAEDGRVQLERVVEHARRRAPVSRVGLGAVGHHLPL